MIVKDGITYTPIFAELATFLIEKSTFDVYYASYLDSGSNMVKLTKDNAEEFINRVEGSRKRGVGENALYLAQELPELSIKIDNRGYEINSSYRGFDFLYLEDREKA